MNKLENHVDMNDNIIEYLTDFEHLKYGIAVIKNDSFSTLIQANSAYYELIGYSKEEFLENHQNRIKEILVDNLCQNETRISKEKDFEYDLRIRTANNDIRWIHGFAHHDTELDVFYLTIADISDKLVATARHLSYEVFQIRNEILGYLNIYTNELITVTDVATDEVVYMNPSASKMLDFKQESDWYGKSYREIAFGSKENTPSSYYEPVCEDEFTDGEHYNEFFKRYYNVKSKIINSKKLNRKFRLNIITDITAQTQLVYRIDMRRVLQHCIEKLFATTTTNDMTENVYYDVLKQLQVYYGADGAFFYKFSYGTNQLEKIYRVLNNEIQTENTSSPIHVDDSQIKLLQKVSELTIEESKNASTEYGELYRASLEQFHIDYEVEQFSCVAVNNSKGQILAFMGITNPRIYEESKELLQLLSRFVCMFLEHKQNQKAKDEASILEEASKANIVQKCALNFESTHHSKENITDSLEALCRHYDADFAMIVHGNNNDDTYGIPYVAGKSIPNLSALQNQPRYTMDKWAETFKKHSQYVTDAQLDSPTAKMILNKQFGIYNFITSPLQDLEGNLTGLLFVCNYQLMNRSRLLVHVVAKNIAEYLEKVSINEKTQFEPASRLANKITIQNRISAILEKEQAGTVFVVNIDNFKQLNETLGHRVGDLALVELADNLKHIFRSTDVVGRIGGDEFIVFTPNLIVGDAIENKAKEILKKCRHYYNKDGISVETSVSIGICNVNDRYKTFQPLYENADYALYVAKRNGKNRYHFYSNAEYLGDTTIMDELKFYPNVVEKLKAAIQNHSFVVHYQPLYHIQTGTFNQAEALVRMAKNDGTLIYPNDFIQVAESSGLVVEMTYQILEQVCQDFRKLLNTQPDTTLKSVAINIPYLLFTDPNMENRFMNTIQKYHINPNQIKLEITERSIIEDIDLVMSKMARLREVGFNFELDDFGIDYSNLQMCISLPLEVTKLDRSLLLSALKTDSGKLFFEHIIEGIHSTGRQTIMEGVETQEQLDWATKLNCNHIQGYYFSKPLDFENFSKFLLK